MMTRSDIFIDDNSIHTIYLYGFSEVGKSSILYTIKKFITEIAKTLKRLNISFDQNDVQYSILTHKQYLSSSQSRDTVQHQTYLILYCFDITDQSSFGHLLKIFKSPYFLDGNISHGSTSSSLTSTAVINHQLNLLVGNKLDMEYWRQVSVHEAKDVAENYSLKYIEVSSHSNMHMNLLVDMLLPYVFVNISLPTTDQVIPVTEVIVGSLKDDNVRQYICKAINQAMIIRPPFTVTTDEESVMVGGVAVIPPPSLPPIAADFDYEDILGKGNEEEVIMHQLVEDKKDQKKQEKEKTQVSLKIDRVDTKMKKSKKKAEMVPETDEQQQQVLSKPTLLPPLPPTAAAVVRLSVTESIASSPAAAPSRKSSAAAGGRLPPLPRPTLASSSTTSSSSVSVSIAPLPVIPSIIPSLPPYAPSPSSVPAAAAAAAGESQVSILSLPSFDDDDDDEMITLPPPSLPLVQPVMRLQLDDEIQLQQEEEVQPRPAVIEEYDEEEEDDGYVMPEKEEAEAKKQQLDIEDGRRRRKDEEEEKTVDGDVKILLPPQQQQKEQNGKLKRRQERIEHQDKIMQMELDRFKLDRLESLHKLDGDDDQKLSAMESQLDQLKQQSQSINIKMQQQDDLSQQAGIFRKHARKIRNPMLYCLKETGSAVYYCGTGCVYGILFIPLACYHGTQTLMEKLTKGNKLFDNVLADNENAFQTLAKLMVFLKLDNISGFQYQTLFSYIYRGYQLLTAMVLECISFFIILISTIILILPSFFTILILRTATVEKESKAFGIRQEVIRYEKPEQSFIRWCRILIRSLPMTFYILVVPYLMVYQLFPYYKEKYHITSSVSANVSDEDAEMYGNTLTAYLIGYFVIIIILQLLGTIRAYYSWNDDDDEEHPHSTSVANKNKNKHSNSDSQHSTAPSLYSKDEKPSSSIYKGVFSNLSITTNANNNMNSSKNKVNNTTSSYNNNTNNTNSPVKFRSATDIDVDVDVDKDYSTSSSAVSKGQLSEVQSGNNDSNSNNHNSNNPAYTTYKPTPIPEAPNSFNLYKLGNYVVLGSLTLEFIQMAFFPLQNDPYASTTASSNNNSNNNVVTTNTPTIAPSIDNVTTLSSAYYFGENVFNFLYITSVSPIFQTITSWCTIIGVFLLLLLFSYQFLLELQVYGYLMKKAENKDKAKDAFFFSFTGSVIYGHGKPRNISSNLRLAIGVLTDGLFLIITYNLLAVVSCDYVVDNNNSTSGSGNNSYAPVLFSNGDMKCWESEHSLLATLALTCYAFYVPLSIMIAPMLMEIPSTSTDNTLAIEDTINSRPDEYKNDEGESSKNKNNDNNNNSGSSSNSSVKNQGSSDRVNGSSGSSREVENHGEVTYMKLYLMIINVVKSIMLLVTTMGSATVLKTVISSTVSSVVLGIVTLLWFYFSSHKNEKKRRREEEVLRITTATGGIGGGVNKNLNKKNSSIIGKIQPCNKAFINTWKAASYTAAVSSAIIIITAHTLGEDVFPLSYLLPVLILTWGALVIIFVYIYYRWYRSHNHHFAAVKDLMSYPFVWRDYKDEIILRRRQNHRKILLDKSKYNSNNSDKEGDNCFVYVTVLEQHPHLSHVPGYIKSPWFDTEYYNSINKNSSINNVSANKLNWVSNDDSDNSSITINNIKVSSSSYAASLPKPVAPLRINNADRSTSNNTSENHSVALHSNNNSSNSSSRSVKNPLNTTSNMSNSNNNIVTSSQSQTQPSSPSATLTLPEAVAQSEQESIAWCVGQYVATTQNQSRNRNRNTAVKRNNNNRKQK